MDRARMRCGISGSLRADRPFRRLDIAWRKPTAIPRKLDPAKQAAFITTCNALLNQMSADEAVISAEAAHPARVDAGAVA